MRAIVRGIRSSYLFVRLIRHWARVNLPMFEECYSQFGFTELVVARAGIVLLDKVIWLHGSKKLLRFACLLCLWDVLERIIVFGTVSCWLMADVALCIARPYVPSMRKIFTTVHYTQEGV